MQLNIDLGIKEDNVDTAAQERVKKAEAKKAAVAYEPTWEEVWTTGWTRHTGTVKKGIFQTKITPADGKRLKEVKHAIEEGQLGTGVESLKKFSKSHALNLHKSLMDIQRVQIVEDMIANQPSNYHLINTEDGLDKVVELLHQEDVVAIDTETTGVKWEDRTVGISFSFPTADEHVYIPYKHITETEQLSKEYVIDTLKPVLERKGLKLVLHNSKFDAHMLQKDGIDIRDNIYFDTMIAMHVLNENEESYALKKLANKYGKFFGYYDESKTFEELFGKDPQAFISSDIILATIYASKDTHLTLMFYQWQLGMMEKQPNLKSVYFDIEQMNTHVAIEMERNGFAMDLDFSREYAEELRGLVTEYEAQIDEQWGDVNVNSPKQLSELFYDTLGYKDVSKKKKVDAKTLKELAKHHPEVNVLLEYRDTNKLLSTYIDPLPNMVRKDVGDLKGDNRLHGQFNQTGTVTGRWASKTPNLQNLPPKARKMIVAPEGKLIIGADYSQIEPRALASMSGDKDFSKPYISGGDLYVQIASDVYDIPYKHCLESDDNYWREHTDLPKHPRKLAKVILLAVMYGISPMSLADQILATPAEAEQFIQDFYKAYPTVRTWMDEVVDFTDKNGYTLTMHGRKRRFIGHVDIAKRYKAALAKIVNLLGREPKGNIWSEELPYNVKKSYWDVSRDYSRVERMSVNAVVQGSAAEILKIAMIEVYKHLETKGTEWKFLGTIHDELLIEIPDTATPEEIMEIVHIMVSTTTLNVPIKTDVEVMTTWGEGVPMEEWVAAGCGTKVFGEN